MLLAIVFVNLWGVVQMTALGSFARTVRIRTVLAAMMAGLFFCAPLAAGLEYAWMAPTAAVTGYSVEQLVAVGGYTVDPAIEEIVRLLPLGMLMMIPAVRRQWSVTDFVLAGAAAGAGFGLAEDLYRFGAAVQYARGIDGGWLVTFQSWAGGPVVTSFVPAISTTLGSWLPDMGGVRLFPPSGVVLPNLLLIWSALAGLGAGLCLRLEGARRWYVALALLAYVSVDHAAVNADITLGAQLLTAPLRGVRDVLPFFPAVALGIAWWVDRERQAEILPEHLLRLEGEASTRVFGTLRAALQRIPESIGWIDTHVRLRRAYNTERAIAADRAEKLRPVLIGLRARLDHELDQPPAFAASIDRCVTTVRNLLRERRTRVWLVLTLPALLWFVAGGWPETAIIQRALSTRLGSILMFPLVLLAQLFVAARVLVALRAWPKAAPFPVAEHVAHTMLRTLAGVGAVCFGVYGLFRSASLWSGVTGVGSAHASDALGSLMPGQAGPMADASTAAAPSADRPYSSQGRPEPELQSRDDNPAMEESLSSESPGERTSDGSEPAAVSPAAHPSGDGSSPGFLQRDGNWLYDPQSAEWYWDMKHAPWVQWLENKGIGWAAEKALTGLLKIGEGPVGVALEALDLPDDAGGRSRKPGFTKDDDR